LASNATPKKFYAVRSGKVPGVYTDWPSAQQQIVGWIKPKHKSFTTRAEAEAFVAAGQVVADPSTVFPLDTPTSLMAFDGTQDASDPTPVAKKIKTTKSKQVAHMPSGPGYDFLPQDAEDGFDSRIIMDPQSGQLRYRTEQELSAKKLIPKTDHHGETLHIWTDGSCMGNGQLGSIGGVGVYFGQNDPR
jgi:ribonuclease HI